MFINHRTFFQLVVSILCTANVTRGEFPGHFQLQLSPTSARSENFFHTFACKTNMAGKGSAL